MALDLEQPIQFLRGVGPQRSRLLDQFGLRTCEDLVYHFPRRYEDRSRLIPISEVLVGQTATVKGEILSCHSRRSRRGLSMVEAAVGDDTGRFFVVWFNQPYLLRYLSVGQTVILHGKVELFRDRVQMSSPEYETLEASDQGTDFAKITPVYSLPEKISQKLFRRIVREALDRHMSKVPEVLPFDIRQRHGLMNIVKSLRNIHFPEDRSAHLEAYQRLSFEEFFLYQMPLLLRRIAKKTAPGIAFRCDPQKIRSFVGSLPFVLTSAQTRVMEEIEADMRRPHPMQRLLHGDVGCGKTVVATIAAFAAVSSGYQVAIMAPTEILARQHYEKIKFYLSGSSDAGTWTVGLLTSSMETKKKRLMYEQMTAGQVPIIIGTHALIEEEVVFKKLGLIIIDEQHKFGVSQRARLSQKGSAGTPDILIMTATPIPRTLSMTLYGDLDVSSIRELPSGRKIITTRWYENKDRTQAYEFIRAQIQKGRQAYVVYPIIEENPALELKSAKAMHKEFQERIFPEFRVGLIHGKMTRADQDDMMMQFRQGQVHLLVATTILEIGIDVANATVMLIENADHFGLSQLHQMRGRIGRGEHESYCLVIADPHTEQAQSRLSVLVEHQDGFRIAEEDLKIRGPGQFFGERQHGLTELRIADPLRQMRLLKSAREESIRILSADPQLSQRPNRLIREQIYRRFPSFQKFMMVG